MKVNHELFKPLHPKFRYMAQDKDGTIAAYTHKPYADLNEWNVDYIHAFSEASILWSAPAEKPVTVANWENSLIKRGEE